MMQDIDELPFSTLTSRKFSSIPDPQRSDVGIAELPRDPPFLKTETPVDTGLIHWFPLPGQFTFWIFCDGLVTVFVRNSIRGCRIGKNTYTAIHY
jgi:hypothetical protein